MKRRMKRFLPLLLALLLCLAGCGGRKEEAEKPDGEFSGSMPLRYAEQFTVDYYADGCALITVGGEDRFLLVPEGQEPPQETDPGVKVLRQPVSSIYAASSSVMDLFLRADALDAVSMTSTSAENWTIPEIRELVREDEITYVGKYSAPDYEAVLDIGCDLAVENTMIWHNPQTKEQLERLGIPVLVELSSYESHPLGRVEWIKLYGLLTGHLAEAEAFFEESVRRLEEVEAQEASGKTVTFFYVTNSGTVNVRRPDDYVAEMIELAGGTYLFPEDLQVPEGAQSATEIQMESFYAMAKDADILIYNSTTQTRLETMEDLLSLSPLFADFKAVRGGNVWCTEQNMFQQVGGTADMITDLHTVITGGQEPLQYLHALD